MSGLASAQLWSPKPGPLLGPGDRAVCAAGGEFCPPWGSLASLALASTCWVTFSKPLSLSRPPVGR